MQPIIEIPLAYKCIAKCLESRMSVRVLRITFVIHGIVC